MKPLLRIWSCGISRKLSAKSPVRRSMYWILRYRIFLRTFSWSVQITSQKVFSRRSMWLYRRFLKIIYDCIEYFRKISQNTLSGRKVLGSFCAVNFDRFSWKAVLRLQNDEFGWKWYVECCCWEGHRFVFKLVWPDSKCFCEILQIFNPLKLSSTQNDFLPEESTFSLIIGPANIKCSVHRVE